MSQGTARLNLNTTQCSNFARSFIQIADRTHRNSIKRIWDMHVPLSLHIEHLKCIQENISVSLFRHLSNRERRTILKQNINTDRTAQLCSLIYEQSDIVLFLCQNFVVRSLRYFYLLAHCTPLIKLSFHRR